MNRTEFLGNSSVQGFIKWMEPMLDKEDSFTHKYVLQKNEKGQRWSCSSIYGAFDNYKWHYGYQHPISGEKMTGNSFSHSEKALADLSIGLREAIKNNNTNLCVKYCNSILQWGGVLPKNRNNIEKIKASAMGIVKYLQNAQQKLSLDHFDLKNDCEGIIMNAGFTKIYSLIIKDFVIYDGRVGAALGLLVRKFCEDNLYVIVPEQLRFSYGNSQGALIGSQNRRNPSTKEHKFSILGNSSIKHINNNIRANWLLKEVIDNTHSNFNSLEKTIQLRAFEAALFMIGYDVLQENI